MGKKDKFFGAVEETPKASEVVKKIVDNEVLAEALSADDEVEVNVTVVEESTNEVLASTEDVAEEALPLTNTALSYFRDNETGKYHLVTVDYNPVTGRTGNLVIDRDRSAMDRLSIEEEFKIAVVNNVFSQ